MVKKPKLLSQNLTEVSDLHPDEASITFHLRSPHQANMVLPSTDHDVLLGDWVRLYTSGGEAGVFCVNSRSDDVGNDLRIGLRHGICILARDKPRVGSEPVYGTLAELINLLWSADGVFAAKQYWAVGSIPQTETLRYEPNGENLLQAMETLLKTAKNCVWQFDQSVFPWVMNVVTLDDTPCAEGRFSRNLAGVSITEDDYELVTRVYVSGRSGYTDADTIGIWGVFSEELNVGDDVTEESLAAYVADYLEAHKNPKVSIRLSAVDLSGITGETIDHFVLGNMCRACLVNHGITLLERIISIEYPDVYGEPDLLMINMNNQIETTPDLLVYNEREAVSSSRNFGRRISSTEKNLLVQAEEIQINAKDIKLKANRTELDSYVLITTLETEIGYVKQEFSQTITTKNLNVSESIMATSVDISSNLKLFGSYTEWKSRTVQASIPEFAKTSITTASGNSITVVTGWATAPSQSRTTLNYLGKSD